MVVATARPTKLESRTVNTLDDLGLVANAWTHLQTLSSEATVFSTWQWNHASARHLWPADALRVTLVEDGGDPVAIWPLAARRIAGCKGLSFLGSGPWDYGRADYQDALIEDGWETEACDALIAKLQATSGEWEVVMLQDLPPSSRLLGVLPAMAGEQGWSVKVEPDNDSYRVPLPATWDEYTSTLSTNVRSNLGRKQRKLEREHNGRFERVDTSEDVESAMDLLFALHNHRWQEKNGGKDVKTIFSRDDIRAFHLEVARNMLWAGMLDLTLLRADASVIGARYSFQFNGTKSFYASGYRTDEEWARFSLGAVMDLQSIQASIDAGLQFEDLLRNDGGYKARYAPQRLDNQRLFIYRTRSARARCEAYFGLRSLAKRALQRRKVLRPASSD